MTKDELIQHIGGAAKIRQLAGNNVPSPFAELMTDDPRIQTSLIPSCQRIQQENPQWLDSFLKKRLRAEKDPRNVLSALGELRAYADLLSLPGVKIQPHAANEGGADFKLTRGGHTIGKVEVFTLLPRPNCSLRIDDIVEIIPLSNTNSFRAGDTIGQDAVSKIASMKQDEHQIDKNVTTIYYVDTQVLMAGFSVSEMFLPLTSKNGAIISGSFYQAFYGRRGDVILEGSRNGDPHCSWMMHDGRYQHPKRSGASAFLFRMLSAASPHEDPLVCYENHRRQLSAELSDVLSASDLFNWELSITNSTKGSISKYVKISNKAINEAEAAISLSSLERDGSGCSIRNLWDRVRGFFSR